MVVCAARARDLAEIAIRKLAKLPRTRATFETGALAMVNSSVFFPPENAQDTNNHADPSLRKGGDHKRLTDNIRVVRSHPAERARAQNLRF